MNDSLTASVARLYRAGSEHSQETKKLRKSVDELLRWMKNNQLSNFPFPCSCTFYSNGGFDHAELTHSGNYLHHIQPFKLCLKATYSRTDLFNFSQLIAAGFLNELSKSLEEEASRFGGATEKVSAYTNPPPAQKWPPISPGTPVWTTEANMNLSREWGDDAWEKRTWGVGGIVISHSDSHGLTYEVRHFDETVGWYDPSELAIIVVLKT